MKVGKNPWVMNHLEQWAHCGTFACTTEYIWVCACVIATVVNGASTSSKCDNNRLFQACTQCTPKRKTHSNFTNWWIKCESQKERRREKRWKTQTKRLTFRNGILNGGDERGCVSLREHKRLSHDNMRDDESENTKRKKTDGNCVELSSILPGWNIKWITATTEFSTHSRLLPLTALVSGYNVFICHN